MRGRSEHHVTGLYQRDVRDSNPACITGTKRYFTEWVNLEGTYTGVNCIPTVFLKGEEGGKLKVDKNTEGVTLLLERQCGRVRYWRWMFRLMQLQHDIVCSVYLILSVSQVKLVSHYVSF